MAQERHLLEGVIDSLSVGVCVWELTEPGDPSSLVLRICTPAAARFLSVEQAAVVGRPIGEGFPGSLSTPLPGVFAGVIESGEGVVLGDVPYQDELVPDSMFSIVVHPLGERSAVVEFTNVTEARRAQAEAKAQLEAAESARMLAGEAETREIMALTSPIIEVWSGVLALPLAGQFDLRRSQIVREKLLVAVSARQAHAVIVDLTGIGTVDELTANELLRLTSALGLLGAKAYLTGISPESAQTMSSLSRPIPPEMCMRTLKDALRTITGV
jgi:anti-anti-sigma regulatory factor